MHFDVFENNSHQPIGGSKSPPKAFRLKVSVTKKYIDIFVSKANNKNVRAFDQIVSEQ